MPPLRPNLQLSTAMNIAPYQIRKMILDRRGKRVKMYALPSRKPIKAENKDDLPGYFVKSTAPYNTDIPDKKGPTAESEEQAEAGIQAIAQDLYNIQTNEAISAPPELLITVHGYNTAEHSIRAWYSEMYWHIADDDTFIHSRKNLVFVGYRWSSERLSIKWGHLWANMRALPDVPQALLALGMLTVLCSLCYWGWIVFWDQPQGFNRWLATLLQIAFGGAIATTMTIVTLLLLRITGYFRDVYRAINFGVPDLTELIRQIDQEVIELRAEAMRVQDPSLDEEESVHKAKEQSRTGPKIRLNFVGHSMGALVITNVVRILSDVFDSRSIKRNPGPEIGNTLSLGRLILASPDIPVLAIVSSRANGLVSSLRRFRETYLFSNEGDLALRLASTAANYISFPSKSQSHGHRLGSIALANGVYINGVLHKKGVINLTALKKHYWPKRNLCDAVAADDLDLLQCLFITHSSGKDKKDGEGYLSLRDLFNRDNRDTHATLADLFTFFDCTDYKDYRIQPTPVGGRSLSDKKVGLLTRAKHRKILRLWDYMGLVWDSIWGKRDVHGGYFYGAYSRQLIYRLAFLGFEGVLEAIAKEKIAIESSDREGALHVFDRQCEEKGIQVYLSPLRYRVDVQGKDLKESKRDMMRTVDIEKPPYPQGNVPKSAASTPSEPNRRTPPERSVSSAS